MYEICSMFELAQEKLLIIWSWVVSFSHWNLIVSILTLIVAWKAYQKVTHFFDKTSLFDFSDRCQPIKIEINSAQGTIHPVFVNDGGDALAYTELIEIYKNEKDENLKKLIKQHLCKIYHNINASEYRIDSILDVRRDSESSWEHLNGNDSEDQNSFDVTNVVKQINHSVYWTTRLTCVRYLQSSRYLKNWKQFSETNQKLFKAINWRSVFENLVSLIESDPSLMVRKSAIDTYLLWAFSDEPKRKKLKEKVIYDCVYYFDPIIQHWKDNHSEVLKNFKKTLGL